MEETIDFTPYSKACSICGSGHTGAGAIQTINMGYSSTNNTINRVDGFSFNIDGNPSVQYREKDISSVTGSYYIYHELLNYQSGTTYMEELQLWLM